MVELELNHHTVPRLRVCFTFYGLWTLRPWLCHEQLCLKYVVVRIGLHYVGVAWALSDGAVYLTDTNFDRTCTGTPP